MTRKSNSGPSRRKPRIKTKDTGVPPGSAPVKPPPAARRKSPRRKAGVETKQTGAPAGAAPGTEPATPPLPIADDAWSAEPWAPPGATDAWPAAPWAPPAAAERPAAPWEAPAPAPSVVPASTLEPAASVSAPRDDTLVGRADERWLVMADLGSLAVIGGLSFLYIAGTGGVVRLALALLFVTFVPGWALARAVRLAGGLTGLAVGVLASLTIGAATSTVMVWANAWHPLALFVGLAAVSGVAILWALPPAFVAARLPR